MIPQGWELLALGAIVGIDLVSFPQIMLARPIVAGAAAGLLLGDVGAGLRIGVLFELFQYDILPVGATRYPEYGPATVVAVGAAHAFALPFAIGLATVVGLFTAMIGGMSLQVLRRLNTRAVAAAAPALERGDVRALYRLHFGGLGRDLARAVIVTAFGLALIAATREFVVPALTHRAERLLSVAATGAGLAAGAAGTLRLVGLGTHLKWLAAGLVGGIVVAWLT